MRFLITLAATLLAAVCTPASAQVNVPIPCTSFTAFPLNLVLGTQLGNTSAVIGSESVRCSNQKIMAAMNTLAGQRGAASGIATLDATSRIPSAQMPLSPSFAYLNLTGNGSTGDISNTNVISSLGSRARALSDRFSDAPSIADFGGPVNGNWTAAFNAAEASGASRIMLPAGRYPTTLNHYQATTKAYVGPGQLVVGANSSGVGGIAEAPFRSFITAPLPEVPDDRTQAFNADWSKMPPGGAAYTFVGSGATGTPTTIYKNFPQLSQTFRIFDNAAGFNTDPGDHAKGRSGMFVDNLRIYQGGQGDMTGRTTFANVYSTRAGMTHFLSGPQVGIENGNLGSEAAARGAYLQKQEYIISDTAGGSVAAINSVMNYHRNNDADGLYQVWGHDRIQSAGPVPIDFGYSLAGPIRRGFDTTPADFGSNQAAIVLKRGQRIFFGGYADPDPLGIQFTATSLGFNYISEGADGHLHITVGNAKTVVIDNLPTASTGLPTGGLYKDTNGFLKVAP